MSDGTLKLGDGLLLKSFRDHPSDTWKMDYKGPKEKGSYHLALWLGFWKEGDATVDERLNLLGWVFDPERARALRDSDRSGEAVEPVVSTVGESAGPEAIAQTPARKSVP